jgi:hypothetical protein
MKIPVGKLGQLALQLIGKSPAAEVAANLHRLKQLMETGRVDLPAEFRTSRYFRTAP